MRDAGVSMGMTMWRSHGRAELKLRGYGGVAVAVLAAGALALFLSGCGGRSRDARDICTTVRTGAAAVCARTPTGTAGASPVPVVSASAASPTPRTTILECVPGYAQRGNRCVPDGTGTPPPRVPTPSPEPGDIGTPAPSDDSGIEGQVLVGPTCPVERANDPCPDRPVQVYVWADPASPSTTVRTDADGRFHLPLPPGTYAIDAGTCALGMTCVKPALPRFEPQSVVVRAGEFTEVTLHGDTGIR